VFENSQLAELAIGRSTVRQRILALLMGDPPVRLHLREIQRRAGTSPGTASRELAKLLAAGLIEREAEGIQVYFRAADTPVAAMMRQVLLLQSDAAAPALPRPTRIGRSRRARATVPAAEVEPVRSAAPATDAEPPRLRVLNPTPGDRAEPDLAPPSPAGKAEEAARSMPELDRPAAGTIARSAAATSTSTSTADPLALLVGARFSAVMRPVYGPRLRGVTIFGARALGPAAEDADVELLVVLDRVDSYAEELERTSAACAQLSLELGLVVSRIFVGQAEWPGEMEGFVPVIGPEAAQ